MPTVVLDTEPALAASGASTVSSDVSSTRALPWHWLDVALIFGSILFGVFSLTYPYGHDQGLYAYVATEWVERGRIPYRDVFDHKPPGIYILYALAVALFGTGMWGIRIFDLACVMTLGFIA